MSTRLSDPRQGPDKRHGPDERHDPAKDRLIEAFGRFGPLWVRWVRAHAGPEASPARMRLLAELMHAAQPLIMRQLTSSLGTTARNITALVDGLEADGLVRRMPHPSDRRATLIEITGEGRRTCGVGWGAAMRRASAVFDDLSVQEQEQLLALLKKLTAALHSRGA